MASLWIRSGYDMKDEMSAETYQVGAHFKALIKAILVAPLKSFERFFRILSSPAGLCIKKLHGEKAKSPMGFMQVLLTVKKLATFFLSLKDSPTQGF